MATVRGKAKVVKKAPVQPEPPKAYLILNDCYESCGCGEVRDDLKLAIKDAMEHFDQGGNDYIYVVQVVKTIHYGKPTVSEGYVDNETDERNKIII